MRIRKALLDLLGRSAAPLAAVAICLGLGLIALKLLGYSPAEVVSVVWEKVIWPDADRRIERWADVGVKATPLLLCGLAIAVAFRASAWNIGAQGQYVMGTLAAVWLGLRAGGPTFAVCASLLLGAAISGAALAALAGLLEWWRKVPVVLSTLLLNFVAFQFLAFLLQGPLTSAGELGQSPPIPATAQLGVFGETRLHWGFILALGMAAAVGWLLNWTTLGFRLRVVGENPVAGRFAGMNVARVSVGALALSGALAGLAGGVEVAGVTHQVTADAVRSGYGFTGIAVALLARLSPLGVIVAAVFFGLLSSAFAALQAELGLPFVTGQAMQGMIVILMLVMTSKGFLARLGRSADGVQG